MNIKLIRMQDNEIQDNVIIVANRNVLVVFRFVVHGHTFDNWLRFTIDKRRKLFILHLQTFVSFGKSSRK